MIESSVTSTQSIESDYQLSVSIKLAHMKFFPFSHGAALVSGEQAGDEMVDK